jgi:hypothetical protein
MCTILQQAEFFYSDGLLAKPNPKLENHHYRPLTTANSLYLWLPSISTDSPLCIHHVTMETEMSKNIRAIYLKNTATESQSLWVLGGGG